MFFFGFFKYQKQFCDQKTLKKWHHAPGRAQGKYQIGNTQYFGKSGIYL
jgi:hypothetical protein